MRTQKKPKFEYQCDLTKEIENLEKHKKIRNVPEKNNNKLLIAKWSLTNFGLQERESNHLKLMSIIIKYFNLIAVQEVAENIIHFNELIGYLGNGWDAIYTDIAGKKERLGYIFNKNKIESIGLVTEQTMRGYERRKMKIQIEETMEEDVFEGFNINPYIANFKAGNFIFTIVNVHLYWSNSIWRQLEVKALSKLAKERINKAFPPHNDIILIGDFNMENLDSDDEIYNELKDN